MFWFKIEITSRNACDRLTISVSFAFERTTPPRGKLVSTIAMIQSSYTLTLIDSTQFNLFSEFVLWKRNKLRLVNEFYLWCESNNRNITLRCVFITSTWL